MCPPRRALACSAGSTLTASPSESAASDERLSVSSITSAVKRPPPVSTAVRQTPLIDTESPRAIGSTFVSTVSRTPSPLRSIPATRALSCTTPVNTSPLLQPGADQEVAVDQLVLDVKGLPRLADALDALPAKHRQRGAAARDDRRDEHAHLVDLVDVEERARQMRAALEQDRLDPAGTELL